MAQKKKGRKHRPGLMGRSDIPYPLRLQMQQQESIVMNREHGAKMVMFCFSVALNEVKGVGYKRQVRFASRFKAIDDEFYAMEPELAMEHARRRMQDLGIRISGEYFKAPVIKGQTKRQQEIRDHVVQASQVSMLCGIMAANDVFGYGRETLEGIVGRARELSERYAREGEGFLLEAMERMGFQVEEGHVIAWADEKGDGVRPENGAT